MRCSGCKVPRVASSDTPRACARRRDSSSTRPASKASACARLRAVAGKGEKKSCAEADGLSPFPKGVSGSLAKDADANDGARLPNMARAALTRRADDTTRPCRAKRFRKGGLE